MMKISLLERVRLAFINWLIKEVEKPRDFPLSNFERIQYDLRPCDVLLMEGRSRVSQVIQLITQSSWSHAALYIGRLHDITNRSLRERVMQFYQGEPDDQLLIESVLGKGIIVSSLTNYKDDHIRICRPQGISRQDTQQVIGYAIGKLGMLYDIRQILDLARFLFPWAILPRRWRSSLFAHNPSVTTKESCSSLIAEAFQAVDFPILPTFKRDQTAGIELIQRNPRLFTPSDFDYSPFFDIIKYPIVALSEGPVYRKLPWNKEGILSDDEGRLYIPESEKKPGTALEPSETTTPSKKPPRVLEFFD